MLRRPADMLLDRQVIDREPRDFLDSVGTVFAEFGEATQDSGNVSYGLEAEGRRYFVKTAGEPADRRAALDHGARVALLRNAARLHASCSHALLARLLKVIESPWGPLLVHEWLPGELLGAPRSKRDDPSSAFQRFRRLEVSKIVGRLGDLLDLHVSLARQGWVAGDFYDGCLIYDFASGRLGVVDLDHYREGLHRNDRGRMFGSTRFMAPEELERGAWIDERSTVFNLGRAAAVFLSDGTLEAFGGPEALREAVAVACESDPSRRFETVAVFEQAWRAALSRA